MTTIQQALKFDCLALAQSLFEGQHTTPEEILAVSEKFYNFCVEETQQANLKISKAHQWFSDYLKEPKVLTNPEDYLGPNWKEVLDFWLYLDGLSEVEKRKMNKSYWALDRDVRIGAWNATKEVVREEVREAAWWAGCYSTPSPFPFNLYISGLATLELIGKQKLLEQGKTLVALPLCLKP
jgi:hypothetical protein